MHALDMMRGVSHPSRVGISNGSHVLAASSHIRQHRQSACSPLETAPIASHQVFQPAKGSQAGQQQQRRHVVRHATKESVPQVTEHEFVFEDIGPCRRRVTITVPGNKCQSAFVKTVNTMRKNVVVDMPGFRADKIPLSMIVQSVGGQKNFKSAVVEEIFDAVGELLIEKLGPNVVPNSEKLVFDVEMLKTFDPAKPLTYSMEYEVIPPVKWRSSYRDIVVTLQETGDFSTDEVAAAALVREMLKAKGHQNCVLDRAIQPGDACIVDMDIRTPGAKEPLPGLKKDRLNLDTEVDPLGLIAGMAGMKVGDARTFAITMPDDHPVEEWRGMVCSATIKLLELFAWNLPKFNDEFVAKHYPQFGSVVAMTQALIAQTTMKRVEERDMQLQLGVRQAVVDCLDMDVVPRSLVESYGEREYKARLMMELVERKSTLEQLEKRASPEMIQEFIDIKKADLEGLVRFSLAVDDIVAAEGLEPDENEVEAVYKVKAKQYDDEKVEYDPDSLMNEVTGTIKEAKVVEWLKDNVKTETLPYVPSNDQQRQPYPQPATL